MIYGDWSGGQPVVVGNDYIDGGLGVDRLSYELDASAGVNIDLRLNTAQNTSGGGIDTILNVENINGTKFNDNLIGNDVANSLLGGAGVNNISGMGGDDFMETLGGGTLDGGAGDDQMWGGELQLGGDGNDQLTSGKVMNGGLGNDALHDGPSMTGGGGADQFFFTVNFAGISSGTIFDFSHVEADKINMRDTAVNFGPLTFVGYNAFSSFVGHNEVRVVAGAGFQTVEVDVSGDHIADLSFKVMGTTPLVATDFIL